MFQHLINNVLQNLLDRFVVVYLYHILIFSDYIDQHTIQVRAVLERLGQHSLYAKLATSFDQTSTEFLGFICPWQESRWISTSSRLYVTGQSPTMCMTYNAFSLCKLLRDVCVKIFQNKLSPSLPYCRKTGCSKPGIHSSSWNLPTAPGLAHPDMRETFVVEADASSMTIGAVLSQRLGNEQTTTWEKLIPAEWNYENLDKELLAIKTTFEEWWHYLEGACHPDQVFTDHNNLDYVLRVKALNQWQLWWALFFCQFYLT